MTVSATLPTIVHPIRPSHEQGCSRSPRNSSRARSRTPRTDIKRKLFAADIIQFPGSSVHQRNEVLSLPRRSLGFLERGCGAGRIIWSRRWRRFFHRNERRRRRERRRPVKTLPPPRKLSLDLEIRRSINSLSIFENCRFSEAISYRSWVRKMRLPSWVDARHVRYPWR